ncbi:class I SAM-dependent methyltransferase [Pseudoduganella namucuonensis]|uniref:Methyltransferase domain-containing protein n=1 Tax=Pseudoduganella namucuonensis TaxID=1035707 RepID=A0A1I7FRW6_9BURK|nr:class I SAM-dependent methyltransferase [Pseudoduganella namucuonensis]SFU38964.1 Methyltransferase domain-containing protein [Pseudoduganella namucuonensis]
MGWTSGYISDIEYTAGFYQEQSPVLLNYVCALNGVEPAVTDSFCYFELGFGRGLTVNLLAASNPNGQFYAADFNPSHVADARVLAAAAELPNVTLLENSFADLAQGAADLPQFDYITLHGIYTWVTTENRQHIVNFIARYLKPGGVVYVSYNAMPGWTASLPLQRLLVEYGDIFPNRSDLQVTDAAAFVQKLVDIQAGYFAAGPAALKVRLDGLKTHSRNYLVHEYMHKHWQPLYHADVARDFDEAKLEFAGSAELPLAYNKLYLTEEKLALINSIPDPVMRETLKDYILNTGFRKDVFVRGARRMGAVRRIEVLGRFGVALTVPRDALDNKMKLVVGEVTVGADIFTIVCDALARKPYTLRELEVLPALAGRPFEDIVQVATLLTASKQGIIYMDSYAGQSVDAAHRMNAAVSAYTRYDDEFNTLCSPLSGNGFVVPYVARLVYWLMSKQRVEADATALATAGWPIMAAQGRRMMKDGVRLESDQENLAELRQHIGAILEEQLPLWRKLNML